MSTQFPVYKDSRIEIYLDETSWKFDLTIIVQPGADPDAGAYDSQCISTPQMDEDQLIDLVVSIIGPAHYYVDFPEVILKKLEKKLKEKHYL